MYISHLLALFLRLIPDTPYLPRMLKGPFSAVVLVSDFSIKIPFYLSLFLEFLLALLVTLIKSILISSFNRASHLRSISVCQTLFYALWTQQSRRPSLAYSGDRQWTDKTTVKSSRLYDRGWIPLGGHHARSSLACLMSSKSIWSVVSRRSIVKVAWRQTGGFSR